MENRRNLDLDVLRSFVAGVELGSFTKAGERLGRSAPALSAQLRKLERDAGQSMFRKSGRHLALTEAGETMLAYARRLLELNDEAMSALNGLNLQGAVRIGLQQEFGEILLQQVLGRFARAHPQVRIDVQIGRNAELLDGIERGVLDLALAWQDDRCTAHQEEICQVPMCWIGGKDTRDFWSPNEQALMLALLEAPCRFSKDVTTALERVGRGFHIAVTSASLAGLWAAAASGMALTVRTPLGLPSTLRVLDPQREHLPPLPSIGLVLHHSHQRPDALASQLRAVLLEALEPALEQTQEFAAETSFMRTTC